MQKLRTEKGITLIALVITIIVMLILVGVSVTVALNGGLFTTAKEAAEGTASKRNEELELSSEKVEINGKWYNSIDEYVKGSENETGEETLAAGLYANDGSMLYSWNELVETERELTCICGQTTKTTLLSISGGHLCNNYCFGCEEEMLGGELLNGKLVIDSNSSITSVYLNYTKLTSIVLPNTMTELGVYDSLDLSGSSYIEEITFSNSVVGLYDSLFMMCPKLKTINFIGTCEEFNSIEKNSNWRDDISSDVQIICLDGKLIIGGQVTIGTETFYVIGDNGETVLLLAKECINVSTKKQDKDNASSISFSSESYWGTGTSPYDIKETTVPIPTNHKAAKAAYDYGVENVGTPGRLMTYQEAYDLINSGYRDIIYGTDGRSSYWLGSAKNENEVWSVYWGELDSTSLEVEPGWFNYRDIRPVVEIPKSEIP